MVAVTSDCLPRVFRRETKQRLELEMLVYWGGHYLGPSSLLSRDMTAQTNQMAGIFGRQMQHRRHNAHINRHLFDPYDPLLNLSELEVFQRFKFRQDTIYFIVEVRAKRRRPHVTGTPFPPSVRNTDLSLFLRVKCLLFSCWRQYIYIYICTYIHIDIHTHVHPHTHTYTNIYTNT